MSKSKPEVQLKQYQDLIYQRHTKDRQLPRGTIEILDSGRESVQRTIAGFPHIKRVFRLGEGVKRLFKESPFLVEEKLDGYNVRIFKQAGRIYALTRGGFICPFTTEWAEIWQDTLNLDSFFREFPEHILCGEVLGDNPYNKQRYSQLSPGAHFFLFEILGPEGNFLPPEDRYQLMKRFNLPSVPLLGKFHPEQMKDLYSLVLELNQHRREGVVLKSVDGQRQMKFVTPNTDLTDLQDGLRIGFDLPSGFFFNRYMRASFFIKEMKLDEEEYARRIGKAFLQGCPSWETFQEASEDYQIYVKERKTWENLRDMLKRQVLIRCDSIQPTRIQDRDMLHIQFRRVYEKSTSRYRRMLQGYLHQD